MSGTELVWAIRISLLMCVGSPSSGMQRLYDYDLSSIIDKIGIHSNKWEEIGVHLGFKHGDLDSIKGNPISLSTAPGSFLRDMLAEWLQWAPSDGHGHSGYATVQALQVALRKAKLGVVAEGFDGFVSANVPA